MKRMYQITACMLVLAGCLITVTGEAKIWRVNNFGGAAADFTTAQAAHNGASAGDTVYFESSPNSYGDLNCSKKLILVGTGYFLEQNPETQSSVNASQINHLVFAAGSAGSQLIGMVIIDQFEIYDSHITVKRNLIYPGIAIRLSDISWFPTYLTDILIKENFMYQALNSSGYYGTITNMMIRNNFFGGNCCPSLSLTASSSCILENNVFGPGFQNLSVYNSQIHNNIMANGSFYPNNNLFTNNIANSTQFGNLNNNLENVDPETVFACYSSCTGYSDDGRWQLKPGSPAMAAGIGGTDCGMFGGPSPYILSGIPDIPAIYYFTVYSNYNQLNVNLKVKSHN